MPLKQQAVLAHDAIDPLVVRPGQPGNVAPTVYQRTRSSIAVRGQFGDLRLQLNEQGCIVGASTATASISPAARSLGPLCCIRARYAQDVAYRL